MLFHLYEGQIARRELVSYKKIANANWCRIPELEHECNVLVEFTGLKNQCGTRKMQSDFVDRGRVTNSLPLETKKTYVNVCNNTKADGEGGILQISWRNSASVSRPVAGGQRPPDMYKKGTFSLICLYKDLFIAFRTAYGMQKVCCATQCESKSKDKLNC